MPWRQRQSNSGSPSILLQQTKKRKRKLIAYISREDNWPVRKSELVNKYLKQVIHFTNCIDYEKLQKITVCKTSVYTIK